MDEKELRKNIGENIRVLRAKKRLSQEGLSNLSELSKNYVTNIENEQVNPSILVMTKLADALGVTVNDLIYKQ